jgi:hypothetical protein
MDKPTPVKFDMLPRTRNAVRNLATERIILALRKMDHYHGHTAVTVALGKMLRTELRRRGVRDVRVHCIRGGRIL